MNKLIKPKVNRNDVFLFIGINNESKKADFEKTLLTGRWKIKTNKDMTDLYLEVKTKAFWTKYKYEWHPYYHFKTIDDEDFSLFYKEQEFINDCREK